MAQPRQLRFSRGGCAVSRAVDRLPRCFRRRHGGPSRSLPITSAAARPAEASSALALPRETVLRFFEAFNRRDLDTVMSLYANDAVHHDLAYESPAEGQKDISTFIREFSGAMPTDMQFIVDDITSGDPESVGVIWHMEIGGMEMPFGKGVSFYKVDPAGRIFYVRECPEHFAKLAFAAPPILSLAAPLVRGLRPILQEQLQMMSSFSDRQPKAAASYRGAALAGTTGLSGGVRSASVKQMAEPAVDSWTGLKLDGKWTKDMEKSDLGTYDRALDLMGIRGIQKTTAQLIDGVELSMTEKDFTMRFLTIVPHFKVTEVYSFDREVEISRRDLRPGWQRGSVRRLEDGRVEMTVELGPQEGWRLTEVFSQNSPDELCIRSTVVMGGEEASFMTMYTRGHG